MKRIFISLFLTLLYSAIPTTAQNPIIRNQYTADPTVRVFDGKLYLYPSHDIISPVEPEREWFCMADYHVFSSDNLTDWEDHGVILDQKDVPWGNPAGYAMWAPDCVRKNGKYYFYFPDAPKEGRGFFYGKGIDDFVDQYAVDGSEVSDILPAGNGEMKVVALRHSVGLVSTLAAVTLAADNDHAREFVERLWTSENKPYDDGYFDAYYDGLLRLFAFLHLSGNYRVIPPVIK